MIITDFISSRKRIIGVSIGIFLLVFSYILLFERGNTLAKEKEEDKREIGKILEVNQGETIFLEVRLSDNKIEDLHTTANLKDSNSTIIIRLNELGRQKGENQTLLSINNPLNLDLEYKASIFLSKYNQWIDTDVIPVESGLVSNELWPDEVSKIHLYDFTLK